MTVVVKRKRVKRKISRHAKIRHFRLGQGLPSVRSMAEELEDMRAVLMGEERPPVDLGIMTLMEVAEAYFSRACDMEQRILAAQREGHLPKSGPYNSFRTQELRSFKEMAKSATELGSRRITHMNERYKQERLGRESGV